MSAVWTVLGAGSILPRAGYGCSGYALRAAPDGPVTLFDCGPGSVRRLGESGIGLEEVTGVVVSHFHPDHCLDLFALAFARRNPALDGAPPLTIVGPRGLVRLLEGGSGIFGRWVEFEGTEVREVEPGGPGTIDLGDLGDLGDRDDGGELRLSHVATHHTAESLAWRADLADGTSVTYTGDTPENPEVARLAQGTDLFVAECSFREDDPALNHLRASGAGRLAREAGCAKLLLTHFYPGVDPEEAARTAARHYDGPIELARDGSEHRLDSRCSNAPRR